jgi:pimeloyl-ACP methyl ester carboxylesterase
MRGMTAALVIIIATLVVVGAGLAVFTRVKVSQIEAQYPPIGTRIDIAGHAIHVVYQQPGATADLPPLVFLHGASGNLRDPMNSFAKPLAGRAEMLFVDRPGHGYSERGAAANRLPDGQAATIAALMEERGMHEAIIVAHSFGGAIAASLALNHPDKVRGLVFLAPATHPWPGGVAWYYGVARSRLFGPLFTNLVSLPVGLGRVAAGARCVFSPNVMPDDYPEATGTALVLRPANFRANATDVANLQDYVVRVAPRYSEIKVPTIIITGDRDGVVRPDLHSDGLARDIAGAELVTIRNLGHKPDYVARDLAIAAIEKVAGLPRDLAPLAARVEAEIAGDNEPCV